jgi:hypothetical protein
VTIASVNRCRERQAEKYAWMKAKGTTARTRIRRGVVPPST